jgi:hypothetical protein
MKINFWRGFSRFSLYLFANYCQLFRQQRIRKFVKIIHYLCIENLGIKSINFINHLLHSCVFILLEFHGAWENYTAQI